MEQHDKDKLTKYIKRIFAVRTELHKGNLFENLPETKFDVRPSGDHFEYDNATFQISFVEQFDQKQALQTARRLILEKKNNHFLFIVADFNYTQKDDQVFINFNKLLPEVENLRYFVHYQILHFDQLKINLLKYNSLYACSALRLIEKAHLQKEYNLLETEIKKINQDDIWNHFIILNNNQCLVFIDKRNFGTLLDFRCLQISEEE